MKRWTVFYIIISLIAVLFIFGPSYSKYHRLRGQLASLNSDITRLKTQNKELAKRIQQIQENAGVLEDIARRKYRMGSPGETIYIISSDN